MSGLLKVRPFGDDFLLYPVAIKHGWKIPLKCGIYSWDKNKSEPSG
jgi:hypothetical protein